MKTAFFAFSHRVILFFKVIHITQSLSVAPYSSFDFSSFRTVILCILLGSIFLVLFPKSFSRLRCKVYFHDILRGIFLGNRYGFYRICRSCSVSFGLYDKGSIFTIFSITFDRFLSFEDSYRFYFVGIEVFEFVFGNFLPSKIYIGS